MKKAPLSVFVESPARRFSSGRSLEPVPESEESLPHPGGYVQSAHE